MSTEQGSQDNGGKNDQQIVRAEGVRAEILDRQQFQRATNARELLSYSASTGLRIILAQAAYTLIRAALFQNAGRAFKCDSCPACDVIAHTLGSTLVL